MVNSMKVEVITVNLLKHKILHWKSTEVIEVEIEKKKGLIDALAYIEAYLDESGLELFNTQVRDVAHFYFLREK